MSETGNPSILTVDEMVDALRCGGEIACDTSSVWGGQATGTRNFTNCWGKLRNWRRKQNASPAALVLYVPAMVFKEKLLQARHDYGVDFNLTKIEKALQTAGAEIVPFTQQDAAATARWLAGQFENRGLWHAAKRARILRVQEVDAKSECPSTTDWLIAGQTHARGWILITNDQGIEFRNVRRASLATFLDAVDLLLGDVVA